MTLLRSAGSDIYDEAGHFNLSASEGVSALRWIQDGVGRGWFPPHAENLEIEDCSSPVSYTHLSQEDALDVRHRRRGPLPDGAEALRQ